MSGQRVAVMGAGSVGCYLGGWLARSHRVTLIARERVVDEIDRHGLRVSDLHRRQHTLPATAVALATDPSAAAGADVVLLTTKSAGTAEATRQIAPYLTTETIVVSFQNGLRNALTIDEALGEAFPSRASRPLVLSGMVPFNLVADAGAVQQTSSGTLVVKDHPRVDPFVRACRSSGLPIEVHPDMRTVLHAKLLLNLNNAVNALSGLTLATQLRDRDHRRVLAACQEESLAVSRAAGVEPARLTALPPALMPRLLRSPTPVFASLARASLTVSPTASSSMAEDLARGRPTEIDEFQGVVVELGERHRVPTPVCQRVTELVREAEQAGADRPVWSGPRLRRAVGA